MVSIPNMLGIDINDLKKKTKRMFSANGSAKKYFYNYENFHCYTISNNEVNYLTANKTLLVDIWKMNLTPINLDGILGSDWFKNKSVRVDMLNGIFEISE